MTSAEGVWRGAACSSFAPRRRCWLSRNRSARGQLAVHGNAASSGVLKLHTVLTAFAKFQMENRGDAVIEGGKDNGVHRSNFRRRESAQSFSPNIVYLPTLSLLIRIQSMDCFSGLSVFPSLIYWSACSTAISESLMIGCKTVALISPSLID